MTTQAYAEDGVFSGLDGFAHGGLFFVLRRVSGIEIEATALDLIRLVALSADPIEIEATALNPILLIAFSSDPMQIEIEIEGG